VRASRASGKNDGVRVVAGSAKGRIVRAPEGKDTRPTSDRVREAIFNALGSLGVVDDARVVDLYAGSGALGIEALSRGAAHATFVDQSRVAVALIHENLAVCGLADRATVVNGDVARHRLDLGSIDLVLADPPYVFDGWVELFGRVPSGAFVVAESNRALEAPSGWELVRQRRYGTTWVTFLSVP
jgi:16S rRNA (guanine966-N2)-methyltransferase